MPEDVRADNNDTDQEHDVMLSGKRKVVGQFDKIQRERQERMQKEIALLEYRLALLINEFRRSHNEFQQSQADLRQSHNDLQAELHMYLSLTSLGIDTRDIPLRRYIPVRVYLSESNEAELGAKALNAILDRLDLSVSDISPVETGSVWQKFFAKTNEVATQPEIAERLQKLERAIDIQGLHQPQSQVDKNEAEAISAIISALDKVSSAAIQVGSVVIIKLPDSDGNSCIQARTLSQRELILLEKNPLLLKEPKNVLDLLADFNLQAENVERNSAHGYDARMKAINPKDAGDSLAGHKFAGSIYTNTKNDLEATRKFSRALVRAHIQQVRFSQT